MKAAEFVKSRRWASTEFGEIAYVERGEGPAALFVHGLLFNGYLWRDVIDELADARRSIAIDLMAHGATRVRDDQPLSFDDQAAMLVAFMDALGIDSVDLVGHDSGGGIAQVFAAHYPQRLRTLVLTNCDTHDNYPPPAAQPFIKLIESGEFGPLVKRMLGEPDLARSFLSIGYEHPERVEETTITTYLAPLVASEGATRALERFVLSEDSKRTVRIESALRALKVATLIVWATDDAFFDKKWAYWLKDTIPGAVGVIEAQGGKLFFPEERPIWLSEQLRQFWAAHST